MFRENTKHNQLSLFNTASFMNENVRKKLEKTWAPVFYEHVFCKTDEKPFAVLYSNTGHPNFPVNILLSLEYIKHLMNYTDDELIENFYFNYLVNCAVGIRTLGEINLAERTLYEFRSRVYRHTREHPGEDDLIFGQFLKLLDEFASVAGLSADRQRMDSTAFMSNIKKSGRLALAYDVLVKAVKAIPEEKRCGALKEVLAPEFKSSTLSRVRAAETASRMEAVLELCRLAQQVLKELCPGEETEELKLLNRFTIEQAEYQDGRLKPKEDVPAASLQSAHDPDATFRLRGNKGQSSYVANITETCSKENPFQAITDYKVAPNCTSDVQLIRERLPRLTERTGCKEIYVDGGYYSPQTAKVQEECGVEIHYTGITGRGPARKIELYEFAVDEQNCLITRCPAGAAPLRSAHKKNQFVAHFSLEQCAACALLDRMRAGIEATNSALKRRHGMDRLRVRGLHKCQVVVGLKVTAQNFRRFCRYILEKIKTAAKSNTTHEVVFAH